MQEDSNMFRILTVDDDSDAINLSQAAIRNHIEQEAESFTATSVSDALTILENQEIDLVIADLDMSNTNGFHLLKKIKANDPYLQIIILTAHDSPNALRSAISLGADDFFLKPFKTSELIASISHLRDKRRRWQVSGLAAASEQRP
jgi:two-component system, response regulator YesN